MKKYLLFLLILASCGGSGGSSNTYSLNSEISGLAFPVRIEQLPSGKLLIAELANGKLSIYDRTKKSSKTLATFPIDLESGIGISGLLVDSDFNNNGYIYIYHGNSNTRHNVLTRLTMMSESIKSTELLNTFSKVSGHNGGGMLQLEDGNILLGTGDAAAPNSAQDKSSINGKLILLGRNGEIINANYSIGLRNPFGITKAEGQIFVLDNGPGCDDEINLVKLNANFGWRDEYKCREVNPSFTSPIYSWSKSEGATDILYSKNSVLAGKLLVARYNTKSIFALNLDGSSISLDNELFSGGAQGSIIDILETQNGEILLASQDGNIYQITN